MTTKNILKFRLEETLGNNFGTTKSSFSQGLIEKMFRYLRSL